MQMNTEMSLPIRVGVLANDPETCAPWELEVFAWIANDPRFELVVFIVNDQPAGQRPAASTRGRRLFDRAAWDWRAYRLIQKLDTLSSRGGPENSDRKNESVFDASDVKQFPVQPERRGFVDYFGQGLTEKIAQFEVDLFIRHGFGIIRGPILELARFGIWSFHHGDNDEFRGSPPGFWESATSAPVTGATLQVLTDKLDGGLVISKCWQSTQSNASKNAEGIFEQSVRLIQRELDKLARTGQVDTNQSATYDNKLFRKPRAGASAGYAIKRTGQLFIGALRSLRSKLGYRAGVWSFGIGRGDFENAALWEVQAVQPRPGTSWATPFFVDYNGETALLFEEFHHNWGRASIAWATVNEKNEVQYVGTALDAGYHMSYPYVLSHAGVTTMYPQCSGNKRIEVWQMGDSPENWSLVNTALDGHEVVDTVVLEHNGQWWLFCSLAPCLSTGDYNELHVFMVDGPLLNTVEPHPMNPVVIDSRSGRNGGRPFVRDGKLFRPAKNSCCGIHGYGINLMEVVHLDEAHFEEKAATSVAPNYLDGIVATHHLDARPDRFVIDFQY
jgi:hypothetical protein